MLSNQGFLDYFNEVEVYCLRSERFFDDVSNVIHNPFVSPTMRMQIMTNWMQASYEAGYAQAKKDLDS